MEICNRRMGKGEVMKYYIKRFEIERDEDWRKICAEIPALKFPPDWSVRIIPPFAGAVARFIASKNNKTVSVYCDWYDNLGYFGAPHWEAFPIDDSNKRFALENVEELIADIDKELSK